jgi:predicted Fe-Mo cluster-binding NifX family protein
MKIMLATEEGTLESMIADRFARAPYFLIYDTESGNFEVVENSADMAHGMGPKAVQIAIDNGAEVLISALPGGNAMEALKSSEIAVYDGRGLKASEAIEKFKNGELKRV